MKIVIPDDYQDTIHRLEALKLLDGHEVTRYRTPARDLGWAEWDTFELYFRECFEQIVNYAEDKPLRLAG